MHAKAKSWLEKTLSGSETVAFSWSVLLAFVRLTTRPGLFRQSLPVQTAFDLLSAWLDQTSATVLEPGPKHLEFLCNLLLVLGAGGNLASDAHLAALAIEHGAELCSCDSDFARFPGLRWRNPLESLVSR